MCYNVDRQKQKRNVINMAEEQTTVERTQEKIPTEEEKKSKVRNFTFHVYPSGAIRECPILPFSGRR